MNFGTIKRWASNLDIYLKPVCLRMFFLGFSAGLPLLLILGTLAFWLREAGTDLKIIGFMSWLGLAYGCKWAWSPIVDNVRLPFLPRRLGQRKSWLIFSQVLVCAGLLGMAFSDPQESFARLVVFAAVTAFASATQDISLDAYRIESAAAELQAALAATYQTGYRLAMIWAGAGCLALAAFASSTEDKLAYDPRGWMIAYCVMSASMLVGLVTTLLSPAPSPECEREKNRQLQETAVQIKDFCACHPNLPSAVSKTLGWFKAVCLSPLYDFFIRYRYDALIILLLIATYRISDVVMGVMSNPFYRDLGFSKEEVSAISKVFGVVMTLLGAFLGGIVVMKIGILKTLFLGALLSSATNLLFSCLAQIGHSIPFLIVTVSADNLAGGLASAAFVAYLSGLTNVKYSATQYALFSSIMLLLPKFIAGFSGVAVESVGYSNFFIGTALLGIPVLLLIPLIGWLERKSRQSVQDRPDSL